MNDKRKPKRCRRKSLRTLEDINRIIPNRLSYIRISYKVTDREERQKLIDLSVVLWYLLVKYNNKKNPTFWDFVRDPEQQD